MRLRVRTKSGAVWWVNKSARTAHRVRKLDDWDDYDGRGTDPVLTYQDVDLEVGRPMTVIWGTGRDRHSPDDGLPDEARVRATVTTPVVEVLEYPDESA